MWFLHHFDQLKLDLVGIVAILGEASVLRTSQISALSWHHTFPRLMPAPQALLKHAREQRLPTQEGAVVGAYSGKVKYELNFFCQVLHRRDLDPFEVEVVDVEWIGKDTDPPYKINHVGYLCWISVLGTVLSLVLGGLSIGYKDGWALLGTGLLSVTSTLVGLASRWTLVLTPDKQNPNRQGVIPDGDVVIYYPNGAFRIVRCAESTSRLYFNPETVEPLLSELAYRIIALSSTVTLMFGLICLGNSRPILQLAFAASYVLLNAVHWIASTIKLQSYWKPNYKVTPISVEEPHSGVFQTSRETTRNLDRMLSHQESGQASSTATIYKDKDIEAVTTVLLRRHQGTTWKTPAPTTAQPPRVEKKFQNFTTALWKAIALTGTANWLRFTNIAPHNEAWDAWIAQAEAKARPRLVAGQNRQSYTITKRADGKESIVLPDWRYQEALNVIFEQEKEDKKRRPTWPKAMHYVIKAADAFKSRLPAAPEFASWSVYESDVIATYPKHYFDKG